MGEPPAWREGREWGWGQWGDGHVGGAGPGIHLRRLGSLLSQAPRWGVSPSQYLAWVPDIGEGSPKSRDDQSGFARRTQAHRALLLSEQRPWKCWSVCLLRFLWGPPGHVPTCCPGEGAHRGLRTPFLCNQRTWIRQTWRTGSRRGGGSLLTKQSRRRRETWQR